MRIPVTSDVGMSDGEIHAYHMEGDVFTVEVNAWNGQLLRVRFADAVGVSDLGVGDISALCEEDAGSPFMAAVLERLYEATPPPGAHRLYQFLDLDDQPALQVVAAGVSVTSHGVPTPGD